MQVVSDRPGTVRWFKSTRNVFYIATVDFLLCYFFLSFALIGLFLKCIDQLVRLELFSYPKEKRKLLNDVKAEKKN